MAKQTEAYKPIRVHIRVHDPDGKQHITLTRMTADEAMIERGKHADGDCWWSWDGEHNGIGDEETRGMNP